MSTKCSIDLEIIRKFWFDEVRPPLNKALEICPDDKLDWAPAEKMITLGNNFMHIAEAGSWWIDKIIDNGAFFDLTPCPSLPKDKIKELMDGHWQRLENFFNRCPGLFEKTYSHTWRGKPVQLKAEWIMMHLFEHDIHHRSQINHYLRILGITPPKI
jgi:uncharacterized damage-inducible protein DinB